MLTRKIGAHWTIPGMMIGWGSMAMINAGVGTYAGVVVCRLLLGAFEAAFASTLIFYLTTFYTRGELGMASLESHADNSELLRFTPVTPWQEHLEGNCG